MPRTSSPLDPVADDDRVQRAVMAVTLDLYPVWLSLDELLRELAPADEDRDPVERAVRDLAGAGLLHRHGPFLLPTRAAVRAAELDA